MKVWKDEEIEGATRSGDAEQLARILGFEDPLVPVAPSVRGLWGWSDPHVEWGVRATSCGEARLLVIEANSTDELARVARQTCANNPASPVLIVALTPGVLKALYARRSGSGRLTVSSMTIDRARPDSVGLAQLRALALDALAAPDLADSALAVARHFEEALDQEGLARDFFRGFSEAVRRLTDTMVAGPDELRSRHEIALTTMLRLVFLYLLQRKGALDRDPWFVMRRVREARSRHVDIYRDCLRPLFFGLLNTPKSRRDPAALALGEVPFLNGGLFEPLPAEVAHAALTWPVEVWTEVFEGLLERFHFTARESSHEQSRSVDPEMLGKVFEGLMFGDDRASSGSFYTPREVVREIVEDALVTWGAEQTGVDRLRLIALVEGRSVALTADEKGAIDSAFSNVTVLDPAVGTGAFLLETLHVLCRILSSVRDTAVDYASMRQVIHRSLYGVDLQPTASRLCALRLWLALMTTLPEGRPIESIPALPNLTHRVATGNALLDADDLVARSIDGRRFIVESQRTAALRESIADVQRAFLTTHGPAKADTRRELERLEQELHRELLSARLDRLRDLAGPLRRLAGGVDLFGSPVVLDQGQSDTLSALEREIAATRERLDDLDAGRAAATSFDFGTRFAAAMGEGGFDIVVTNPPWVRAHRIDPDQRALLKARYRSADNDLWPGASALGVRAAFGTQVDLSALFLERSLELLKPGGRLAALVPAKLLRSLHGASLRRIIAQHQVERIEDHSEAREAMFDATTYPAFLMVRKTRRARRSRQVERPMRVGVWRGDSVRRWQRPSDRLGLRHPAAPWILVEPGIERIFDTMWRHCRPLGLVDGLSPSRGIFTGCNDVFLRPPGEFERMLGPMANEFVRPVLAGRDLDEEGWATSAEILWLYDEKLELESRAPEVVEAYFRENAERLRDRADHVSVLPLWQIFRLKPELLQPKVVWPDIAPFLRAEVVPGEVVPLNTTYVIPCDSEVEAHRVAALLNSEPIRAFAWALAERARGGFRRHFAWVMRMLPVPEAFEGWTPESTRVEEWAAEVAALFGITPAECELLRSWRTGEELPGELDEVA